MTLLISTMMYYELCDDLKKFYRTPGERHKNICLYWLLQALLNIEMVKHSHCNLLYTLHMAGGAGGTEGAPAPQLSEQIHTFSYTSSIKIVCEPPQTVVSPSNLGDAPGRPWLGTETACENAWTRSGLSRWPLSSDLQLENSSFVFINNVNGKLKTFLSFIQRNNWWAAMFSCPFLIRKVYFKWIYETAKKNGIFFKE